MQDSTGNEQLDGAALQAYSKWRFERGSVPQVKMPFEFKAEFSEKRDSDIERFDHDADIVHPLERHAAILADSR